MIIDARPGILRGRVLVDGMEARLHREPGGWIRVEGPSPGESGRVRYRGFRDWAEIERSGGRIVLRFGFRRTRFAWEGRKYELGPMAWGDVTVRSDDRVALRGELTFRGVRIHAIAPELAPIARELALALAFHAQALWTAFLIAAH